MACPPKPVGADISPSLFQHSPFTLAERWLLNWTVCCCSRYWCYTRAAGREHPVGAVRSPWATGVRGWDGVPFQNHCIGFHTQAERPCLGFTNSSLEAQIHPMDDGEEHRQGNHPQVSEPEVRVTLLWPRPLKTSLHLWARIQRACFKASGALLLRSRISAGEKGTPVKRRWAGYALCGESWSTRSGSQGHSHLFANCPIILSGNGTPSHSEEARGCDWLPYAAARWGCCL